MGFLDLFKYDTYDSIKSKPGMNAIQRRQQATFSDNFTKSQREAEIGTLKQELQSIENDLDAAYGQIGRRFMEKADREEDYFGVDIRDILRVMEPKLEKKKEIERQLASIEKEMREIHFLREKEEAALIYQDEKARLDKALAMDVLNKEEYEEMLRIAQKKADNFEEIRRVKQQFDLSLITAEERDARIEALSR